LVKVNTIAYPENKKSRIYWKLTELVILAIGFVGSATACLAEYNWHWFRESMTYMIWSAAPFVFLALGNYIARRLVKSHIMYPVSALLAFILTFMSLNAYIGAVLHPHHSSGMVFAVLPLLWMMAILAVLTVIVVGFFVAARLRTIRNR
jgi:hypothetical protein